MINQVVQDNGVNRTGAEREGSSPGRCSPAQQRGPGRHPATARMKWNKEVNTVVMECFYITRPFYEEGKPIRGYRQWMLREWKEKGVFESTEQRMCDQASAIRKNGWLTELELEMIRRTINDERQMNSVMDEDNGDEVNRDIRVNEIEGESDGQMNEPIERVDVDENSDEVSQENKQIMDRLKQIMLEGRTSDGILFKKVN